MLAAPFFVMAVAFGALGVLGAVDEAWRRGHRAAAPTLIADAVACLAFGVTLVVADDPSEGIGYAGVAVAIALLLVAACQANRAAAT